MGNMRQKSTAFPLRRAATKNTEFDTDRVDSNPPEFSGKPPDNERTRETPPP